MLLSEKMHFSPLLLQFIALLRGSAYRGVIVELMERELPCLRTSHQLSRGADLPCGQRLDNPVSLLKVASRAVSRYSKAIRAMQKQNGRWPLQLGGFVILGAAILHVVAVFSGPGLVAALGAPPNIVESAIQGTWVAPVVISTIAMLLFLVGFAALSTAGNIRSLPLSRPLLYATSAVLMLRAAALPVILAVVPTAKAQLSLFEVMTAILCFVLGGLFWMGLRRTREQASIVAV